MVSWDLGDSTILVPSKKQGNEWQMFQPWVDLLAHIAFPVQVNRLVSESLPMGPVSYALLIKWPREMPSLIVGCFSSQLSGVYSSSLLSPWWGWLVANRALSSGSEWIWIYAYGSPSLGFTNVGRHKSTCTSFVRFICRFTQCIWFQLKCME